MNKNNNVEVFVVDEKEIPSIVTSQFSNLQKLTNKYEEALTKANSAKESAEIAHEKSAGLFEKKEAIKALQDAQLNTAEALIVMNDVQKLTLEYQEKITQITQYLFGLGVSNIAANRSVVRQLELKLKGASKEELSDLARQELLNVVKQLKAQEDIMEKQSKLSSKVQDHDKKIKEQEKMGFDLGDRIDVAEDSIKKNDTKHSEHEARQDQKLRKHDEILAKHERKDSEQDDLLDKGQKKDAEHDRRLDEQAAKDAEHDRRLAEQAAKDAEHDRKFQAQEEKDAEHDRKLMAQEEKDAEHDRKLAEQVAKDEEHDRLLEEGKKRDLEQDKIIGTLRDQINELENKLESVEQDKYNKKWGYISLFVGIVALILSVIQFVL